MRRARTLMALAGTFITTMAALGVLYVAVLPRVVRERVVAEAASRGVVLRVDHAKVGWRNISLEGVDARLDQVAGVAIRFSLVRVTTDFRLHTTGIFGMGGRVEVHDGGKLQEEFAAWRSRRGVTEQATSREPIEVDLLFEDVRASAAGIGAISGADGHVRRSTGVVDVSMGTLEGALGQVAWKARDAHVQFAGPPMMFHSASLASADVVWIAAVPREADSSSAGPDDSREPPPPEGPSPGTSPGNRRPAARELTVPFPKLLPDLGSFRASLAEATANAAGKLPEGSTIHADALSLRVQRGADELILGSGRLDVDRSADLIGVNFSTSPLAHSTPLSVHLRLPTGPADLDLSVSGGPVPLGLLGMHDGGLLHLLDVNRTTVAGKGHLVLDGRGAGLTFDLEGAVHDLSLGDPRLARDPVRGIDLGVRARGLLEAKGELRLDDAEASLGAARATLHGGLTQTLDHVAAAFEFDFPTSSCQALLGSMPMALVPTVGGGRMDGTFGLHGRLAADSQNLDNLAFDYDVNDRCRLVDVPSELDKGRFARSFTHTVYSKTGERVEVTTGPGTPSWSDLEDISPYLQDAVLTTEDAAFFHHHGFNHSAIRHAVAANIKAHRFVRGASTITMQLAKNLFLSREKTLARKLEELVLADYLEQSFTKDEMMELYLNIIEFGPDIYGVTAAAEHYFGRRPAELNLAESMFLSSILPNPIAFHKVYEHGKQLSEGWLRTLRARMEVAAHTGLISSSELAEGLTEPVVFHHEGDAPVVPRAPVVDSVRRGDTTDWKELP